MASRSKSFLTIVLSAGLGAATLGMVQTAVSNCMASTPSAIGMDEQYPHMHKAMRDLQAARKSLSEAEDIFKGHREKALKMVDKAIGECQDAINGG